MNNFNGTCKTNETCKTFDELIEKYKTTAKKPLSWLYSEGLFNFVNVTKYHPWKEEKQCEKNWNNSDDHNQISNELFENIFAKINFLCLEQIEKNLTKANIKETKIKFNELHEIFYSKKAEIGEKNNKLDEYLEEVSRLIKEFLEVNNVDKLKSIVKIIVPSELFNIFEKIKKNLKLFPNSQPTNLKDCWDFNAESLVCATTVIENNFLNKSQTFNFEEFSDWGWKLQEYKLNFDKIVALVVINDSPLEINNNLKLFSFKNTENETNITKQNQYKTGVEMKIDGRLNRDYKFLAIKS